MGGFNSGRYGGRPTVESCFTLDLYKLIRQGLFRPGYHIHGTIVWKRQDTGEQTGLIGFEVKMGQGRGHVRLHYATTYWHSGEKRDADYTIALETTPQPLGGRRWWFVCPNTGACVSKLHLPNGANMFASRRAHRLGYRSQRETTRDRHISRAFKLRDRLGGEGGIGDYVPKPKWMRWRTYERQIARIEALEAVSMAHLWPVVQRL